VPSDTPIASGFLKRSARKVSQKLCQRGLAVGMMLAIG
jgi:hypothetical protein